MKFYRANSVAANSPHYDLYENVNFKERGNKHAYDLPSRNTLNGTV